MAKWISLQKTDTGFVFATTHSIVGSQWDWISTVVAEEFECDPADLDNAEGDDGEYVVLNGVGIVRIHDCRMVNEARPLVQLREVA